VSGTFAFRWSEDGGTLPLEDVRAERGWLFAVSEDGSVIVGVRRPGEIFRWTADNGAVGFGDMFLPSAASADGSLMVGSFLTGRGPAIWDATNGMRSLRDVLVDLGADLTGWELSTNRGVGARRFDISGDGTVIIGTGRNPSANNEAWMAVVPGQ
jgi:uncharacterized membrane protein